jgi:hypothetical protein
MMRAVSYAVPEGSALLAPKPHNTHAHNRTTPLAPRRYMGPG